MTRYWLTSLLLATGIVHASPAAKLPPPEGQQERDPFTASPFVSPQGVESIPAAYRKEWVRLTGFEYSGLHWKQFITVFTNTGLDTFRQNNAEYLREFNEEDSGEKHYKKYPVGTVLLKENYGVDKGRPGAPWTITAMVKHAPGYDPQFGDWEYIQSMPDGKVVMRGNSQDAGIHQVCMACHVNVAERDYVYSTFFTRRESTVATH